MQAKKKVSKIVKKEGGDLKIGAVDLQNQDSKYTDEALAKSGEVQKQMRMTTGNSEKFKKTSKSNFLMSLMGSSGLQKLDGSQTNGFNLFTHQKKRQTDGNESLIKDYTNLREAVLELYLSVKIRSDDEIDAYNENVFKQEKVEMKQVDGYQLIDLIKSSVEALMNMKNESSIDNKDMVGSDIDEPDIEIDLPEGAKAGLKDATGDMRLNTSQMNEELQNSLKLQAVQDSADQQPDVTKLNVESGTVQSHTTSIRLL